MKKLLICLTIFLIHSYCFSQERITGLVEAERNFAHYAVEHNTKEAFLNFMDSTAVVFNNGEIKNARAVWQNKKASAAKLIWTPAFAIVSTAGDLGVTTGPWQLKPADKDSIVASGEFSTVWIKKDSIWKWIIDMGIDHNQPVNINTDAATIELNHVERITYDAGRYMLNTEQNFINAYTLNGKAAYNDVADKDIYFVTQGYTPVKGQENIDAALVNLSGDLIFKPVSSGVSKDGDIGYVYGYVSEKDKKGNYLRVWRRIGRKWTLILQTLAV